MTRLLMMLAAVTTLLSLGVSVAEKRPFPDGLMFGTATASYQVEGAWNEDGKGENIWDHFTHTNPDLILDKSNGDIAADSYHNVERDVEMLRELGLNFYRFSISWSRILPTGLPHQINEAGVAYYNKLIDTMLKYNIEPMVTLYHWDLPQKLQELGGWANGEIVNWFGDYSRIAFTLFGDRVKYWNTINEFAEICYGGYGGARRAPAINSSGYADYLCAKNLLLAHAESYHIYDNEFRNKYNGTIGAVFSYNWREPDNEDETEAAEREMDFTYEIFVHPIFSETGNFPQGVIDRVAAKSAEQGYFRSRLPTFTQEQVEYIKGTADFMGINHYTTNYVYNRNTTTLQEIPSFEDDKNVIEYQADDWPKSISRWLAVVPWGFYKALMKIKDKYNNPLVYITENGYSSDSGLDDEERINYYKLYLNALLDAIDDGCNVQMYTAWSLMDNFEWADGYEYRFGLYEVDMESENRTRTPRRSAFFYKHLLSTRNLDLSYEPPYDGVMTIDVGH